MQNLTGPTAKSLVIFIVLVFRFGFKRGRGENEGRKKRQWPVQVPCQIMWKKRKEEAATMAALSLCLHLCDQKLQSVIRADARIFKDRSFLPTIVPASCVQVAPKIYA